MADAMPTPTATPMPTPTPTPVLASATRLQLALQNFSDAARKDRQRLAASVPDLQFLPSIKYEIPLFFYLVLPSFT